MGRTKATRTTPQTAAAIPTPPIGRFLVWIDRAAIAGWACCYAWQAWRLLTFYVASRDYPWFSPFAARLAYMFSAIALLVNLVLRYYGRGIPEKIAWLMVLARLQIPVADGAYGAWFLTGRQLRILDGLVFLMGLALAIIYLPRLGLTILGLVRRWVVALRSIGSESR